MDFSNAVEIVKNRKPAAGARMYTQRNMPPSIGYPSPQWGSGRMGNMLASWRKRLGPDFEERNRRRNPRWSRPIR